MGRLCILSHKSNRGKGISNTPADFAVDILERVNEGGDRRVGCRPDLPERLGSTPADTGVDILERVNEGGDRMRRIVGLCR
jgi:hypothetical protein